MRFHHAFEFSARHGLEWWQFDLSWLVIRGMQAVGLAWKVKLPSATDLANRRRDPNTRPPVPTTSDAPIPDASN